MKLYEVPRNTWIKPIDAPRAPPEGILVRAGEPIFFHHCDGMYSLCCNQQGKTVHLPAWEEVEVLDGLHST